MEQTQPYQNVIERMNRAGYEGIPFLFALDYEQQHGLFIENPLEQTEVLFRIAECTNIADRLLPTNTHRVPLHKKPIPIEEYAKRFATIQDGMRKGRSLLANLTVRTPIETPLSLKEILFSTTAPYQLYVPSIPFVCFSPEQFVNISRDGLISTAPMKGTIASDTPGAPSSILNDYKETSEHCAVVDLLLRDLSGVAENVHVKRFRFFTEIPTQQDRKLYQVTPKYAAPSQAHGSSVSALSLTACSPPALFSVRQGKKPKSLSQPRKWVLRADSIAGSLAATMETPLAPPCSSDLSARTKAAKNFTIPVAELPSIVEWIWSIVR